MMAASIYHADAEECWTPHKLWNGEPFYTKLIYLQRNLIGQPGTIRTGYYRQGSNLFVTFSGTDDLEDWLYNLDPEKVTHPSLADIQFHRGFYYLAKEVRDQLFSTTQLSSLFETGEEIERVYWSGHSAGGAVAGIIPSLLPRWRQKHFIVDFGTPRYLSSNSPSLYPRLRYQEIYDVVPCIPGPWRGFRHFGRCRWVTPSHNILDKPPWYRYPLGAWKYLTSTVTLQLLTRITQHHSIAGYTFSVLKSL